MTLPDDDKPLLLHNPRCSKSRAAKALLEERGVDFDVRLYLEDPLEEEELRELGARLVKAPADWIRTKESAFAENGLSKTSSDGELYAAMSRNPILMERPILVRGKRAAVGRPTEALEALLDG